MHKEEIRQVWKMKEMIKTWYANEKEKMSEMTKEQKREYITEYYGAYIVVAVLVLIAIVWLFYHFLFDNHEEGFNCAMVNYAMEESSIELSDTLTEYYGYNPKKKTAYFDPDYQISYPGVVNRAADNSFYEKFFLNVRMGMMDAAIMPQSYMEYCNTVGHTFYDVYEVLNEEQIEKYEPYFIKGKDDEGQEYTCGIDISNMKFFEKMGIVGVGDNAGEPIVLSFVYGGKHLEESQAFLTFLEQYETE